MVHVLAANGAVRALVVYGHDGLDEISTTSPSTVVDYDAGEVRTYDVDPTTFGLRLATLDDL